MDEPIITTGLQRLWERYKQFVTNATRADNVVPCPELTYWRDRLFTNIIIYLFPLCLIALVPGVFVGIETGGISIALFDIATVCLIAVTVFNPGLSLLLRKILVVFVLYCLSIMLIIKLGLLGPGLMYLLMLNVLVTFLFNNKTAYWSAAGNVLLCVILALIIYFKLFDTPLILQYTLGAWIAVSSNLIFLSTVSVMLITYTLSRLEDIIEKELVLKNQLANVNIEIFRRNKIINESEIHYRGLFFLNPAPMWVLNKKTSRILQVNEAAICEYGYSNKEFLTMTISDISVDKNRDATLENVKMPFATGVPSSSIIEHRRKNDEQFYAEVKYSSFLLNGEECTLVIVRNMTEQITFTRAIETQNTKLKEIAWIQSHLVRAPLARIMSLVHLIIINKNTTPDVEVLGYLDQSAKEFDAVITTITNKTEQIVASN